MCLDFSALDPLLKVATNKTGRLIRSVKSGDQEKQEVDATQQRRNHRKNLAGPDTGTKAGCDDSIKVLDAMIDFLCRGATREITMTWSEHKRSDLKRQI